MRWLLHFFTGTVRYSLPYAYKNQILEAMLLSHIPFFSLRRDGNDTFVSVPLYAAAKTEKVLLAAGLPMPSIAGRGGIPALVFRCRRRYGLWAGLLVFLAALVLSSAYVWEVRLTCDGMEPTEARELLRRYGLEAGCTVRSVSPVMLQNRILLFENDLQRVSVNMHGTVAYAELIVKKRRPVERPFDGQLTCVVAACDGFVRYLTVHDGEVLVSPGAMVSEGEMLISGLEDDCGGGIRVRRAVGEIYADVIYPISFEVPYTVKEKRYTGERITRKTCKIFKKEINLFRNSSIPTGKYDKIEEVPYWSLPNGAVLPFTITEQVYLAYEWNEQKRDRQQVEALAHAELEKRISAELADAKIETQTVRMTEQASGLRVDCLVRCLMNIARERLMTADEIEERSITHDGEKNPN